MNSEKTNVAKRLFFGNLQGYLLSTPNNSKIETTLRFLFWVCILIVLGWLFYFVIMTIVMPYQIEYREGAAQVMTQILLKGGNPFSFENQPFAFNNYGIAYNLVVLPLAALFGNTLPVHRTVTFIFTALSCWVILQTIFRVNRDRLFAVTGAIFVLMGIASRGGNGAFPSAMGEFLFLAAVLIPVYRSFDPVSLVLSAILSMVAFYTKPYFVLSFGIVASYVFIFVSKKKGLLYSLLFLLLSALSFVLIRYFYKYYFIDTVISNISNDNHPSFSFELSQLKQFIREFYPSLILAAIMLLLYFIAISPGISWPKGFLTYFNAPNLDQPLIMRPLNYSLYFLVCSSLAFTLILGTHLGSYMNYLYQIVLPPFYLVLIQNIKPASRLGLTSFFILLLNMFLFGWLRFNPSFLQQANSTEWATLYQYVDNSKQVLNTPSITSELIKDEITPVDSGQTEYYYDIKPYADNRLLGQNYDVVKQNGVQYKTLIHNSVINAQYDHIFITKELHSFAPTDIGKYYSPVRTLEISMPQVDQHWTVEIWEPKP